MLSQGLGGQHALWVVSAGRRGVHRSTPWASMGVHAGRHPPRRSSRGLSGSSMLARCFHIAERDLPGGCTMHGEADVSSDTQQVDRLERSCYYCVCTVRIIIHHHGG